MKPSIFFLFLFFLFIQTQAQTIQFQPFDTWEKSLKMATEQKKPILLYAHFKGCSPCRMMEEEVFNQPEVANFYNQHFLNIEIDTKKNPQGKFIQDKFQFNSAPYFIFYDPQKGLLHLLKSYAEPQLFLNEGKLSLGKTAVLDSMRQVFQQGNREVNFLFNYFHILESKGENYSKDFDTYFMGLPNHKKLEVEHLALMMTYLQDTTSQSFGYFKQKYSLGYDSAWHYTRVLNEVFREELKHFFKVAPSVYRVHSEKSFYTIWEKWVETYFYTQDSATWLNVDHWFILKTIQYIRNKNSKLHQYIFKHIPMMKEYDRLSVYWFLRASLSYDDMQRKHKTYEEYQNFKRSVLPYFMQLDSIYKIPLDQTLEQFGEDDYMYMQFEMWDKFTPAFLSSNIKNKYYLHIYASIDMAHILSTNDQIQDKHYLNLAAFLIQECVSQLRPDHEPHDLLLLHSWYAKLLYKIGRKQEAIGQQKKALKYAYQINVEDLESYEEFLQLLEQK